MTLIAFVLGLLLQAPAGQNEFVPVSSLPPSDRMPAAPLLVAAYAFVWLAVCFYLWTLWRRLGKVEADMQALERRTAGRVK
jgi:CcmD family protein